jgi:hypothetical protein
VAPRLHTPSVSQMEYGNQPTCTQL